MATPAIRMLRRLEGLFCVYKPPGVHWKLVRDTVETNIVKGEADPLWQSHNYFPVWTITSSSSGIVLCLDVLCPRTGLNALPSQPLPHKICFQIQAGNQTGESRGLSLTTASLPVLSKHPLGLFIQLFKHNQWLNFIIQHHQSWRNIWCLSSWKKARFVCCSHWTWNPTFESGSRTSPGCGLFWCTEYGYLKVNYLEKVSYYFSFWTAVFLFK